MKSQKFHTGRPLTIDVPHYLALFFKVSDKVDDGLFITLYINSENV